MTENTTRDDSTDDKTMNCDKHREAIAQDPSYDDVHLSQCAACEAFRSEMQALDRKIAKALSLSVPELHLPELPDLDAANVTSLPRRRLSPPAWFAVAATITVVAMLGYRMLGDDTIDPALLTPSLADQIIAHVEHEPYALTNTDAAVSDERLSRVVPASVATMDHSAGVITYAQSCIINGRSVPHLVIQGERGPVTILLMPEEMVPGPQTIHGETIDGVILPVGSGSIAIFGKDGENLESIQESVVDSVAWST